MEKHPSVWQGGKQTRPGKDYRGYGYSFPGRTQIDPELTIDEFIQLA
jgi:hypothetical protein